MQSNLRRLSSGLKVISGRDDAAGYAVAEGLQSTLHSLRAAERATHEGISIAQIADGATGGVTDVLSRMRELAVQASSGALADDERAYVHQEYVQLSGEIDRTALNTEFNGVVLTDGSRTGLNVQVGTDGGGNNSVQIQLGDLRTATLGVDTLDLSTTGGAEAAITALDGAIQTTLSYRAKYGAVENRLTHASSYGERQTLALTEAVSRIVDADLAVEASELARNQLVGRASVAALGQAQEVDRRATEGLLLSGLGTFR